MSVNQTINKLRILVDWVNEEEQLVELDGDEIKALNDSLRYLIELNAKAEKVERYEKALLEIVENPNNWSTSYGKAYSESVRIASKALKLDE